MYQRSFSRRFQGQSGQSRPPSGQFRGNGGRRGFGKQARSFVSPSSYVSTAAPMDQQTTAITHRFEDFPLHPQLKKNIVAHGYTEPTPIQDQAITPILEGKDVTGIANTGTGKTAAFLVPIINKIVHDRAQRTLVIVPTRELAVQIEEELTALAFSLRIFSLLCIGGVSLGRQMHLLNNRPHVIIGTPGRLKDLITRRVLDLSQFQTIVLDEVDRMVDIGFIQDIRYLISLLPHKRQSLFFSATVTPDITQIIRSFQKEPVTVSVKVRETAAQIEQDIIRVKDRNHKLERLHELLKQEEFTKVLIFGRTKWNVERLAKTLQQRGFAAASIHGNKSQNQRLRALTQFKQNAIKIMVATDIAARGLDISNVSHVINFDEPASYTDYVHRIGRTGRANKQGKALTFLEGK